jgi:tripartite-type tricarboxylate transporter receptor subunit TctC
MARRSIARVGMFLCALLISGGITTSPVTAEVYPNKAIHLISPFAAGVSTDVLARALAQKLTENLGQPVIVENRPGANGIIGASYVAKSAPDGYTFLITTGSHTANPHVSKDVPYDALKDFAPITQLAGSYGLVLLSNLPVKSVADLVELAKKKPGQLTYSTSGVGNLTHVAGRLLEARAGIKMIAVPYNNSALIPDTIAGTVDMTFISSVSAVPLVKGGQLKALAVTGTKRAPALPDVPTFLEAGIKDYDLTGYFGILFPANTPADRVDRVYQAAIKALTAPELKSIIETAGLFVVGSTPAEFGAFLKQDFDYQGRLMEELHMKIK